MYQVPRYDDIYYPRTDKRMISNTQLSLTLLSIGGNQYTYVGNKYMRQTF
jgi:hypothetical protein